MTNFDKEKGSKGELNQPYIITTDKVYDNPNELFKELNDPEIATKYYLGCPILSDTIEIVRGQKVRCVVYDLRQRELPKDAPAIERAKQIHIEYFYLDDETIKDYKEEGRD